MEWLERCRARLPEFLDPQGDLAPPWERFPGYERYTLGWRMGVGEDWMGLWAVFLEQLGTDTVTRLAYLRRHPPAPISWADAVYDVLHPKPQNDDGDDVVDSALAAKQRALLLEQGLIASDIAFQTWLTQQSGVSWPWERNQSPEAAARYDTRVFWFWSRQITELRKAATWAAPALPEAWTSCAEALASGVARDIEPQRGLESLARFLAAGGVKAPWQLGLEPASFADSYEMDMGYVDAFRLWAGSSFDDGKQLEAYLYATHCPDAWREWAREHIHVE